MFLLINTFWNQLKHGHGKGQQKDSGPMAKRIFSGKNRENLVFDVNLKGKKENKKKI